MSVDSKYLAPVVDAKASATDAKAPAVEVDAKAFVVAVDAKTPVVAVDASESPFYFWKVTCEKRCSYEGRGFPDERYEYVRAKSKEDIKMPHAKTIENSLCSHMSQQRRCSNINNKLFKQKKQN
jgi:hypothetical protein